MNAKGNTLVGKLFGNTFYFKLLWTILVLLKINPLVSSKTSLLFQSLVVYGGLILMYDLFVNKKLFNINKKIFSNPYILLLFLFVFFMAMSIVANYDKGFISNAKILIITIIQFCVISIMDLDRPLEKIRDELKIINGIIIGGVTIAAIISLYLFFNDINGYYIINPNDTSLDDTVYYYGMAYGNRLVGIFSNPNVTGATCGIALYSALINISLFRNRFVLNLIYTICMIFNFLCIILSASRGTLLSLCVSLFFLIFIITLIKNKKKSHIVTKIVVSILISTICVVLVFSLSDMIDRQLRKIPLLIKGTSRVDIDSHLDEISRLFPDIDEDDNLNKISSGRLRIWKIGLRTVRQKLIFGVGEAELYNEMVKNWDKNSTPFGVEKGGLHNIYLETLVAFGLITFICFMVFLTILFYNHFKNMLKIGFRSGNSIWFLFGLAVLTMLVYIAANNMVESKMLYQVRLSSHIFGLYVGYSIYFIQASSKTEIQ